MKTTLLLGAVAAVVLIAGCARTPSKPAKPVSAAPAPMTALPQAVQLANSVRTFSGRGVVREKASGKGSVTIRHEAIPGFMPAMTMEFTVRNARELRGVKVGDAITFLLKVTDDESGVESLRRVTGGAPEPNTPRAPARLFTLGSLKPGDEMPDFGFMAEDARMHHLSDFRGKAVAFTFIFTRCPMPDFCPRMNRQLGRARDALLHRPEGAAAWQFLSVSFDPAYDTPEILASYARGYRGANADRWLFASASTNVVTSLAPLLDLHVTEENGSLAHNLRTVVLDGRQRLVKRFDGNQWTAEDLAAAVEQAAERK